MRAAQSAAPALLGAALIFTGLAGAAQSAGTIGTSGAPFRFDKVSHEPGGQSGPKLTYWDLNGGFMATWLNYGSASDRRAFVGFFSSFAFGLEPISQMGAASGPTSGIPATSVAPVSFPGGNSLVLFSSDKRGASAASKRDVFAQRMGRGPWVPNGDPLPVNQVLGNAQESVVATRLSNGNALVAFVSHANAAATFDMRGRVLTSAGTPASAEKSLTLNTRGAQTPTDIAPLSSGRSVLAYVVRTGARQEVFVQRLDTSGNRLGGPTKLKTTNGTAAFGGAGVAPLAGGKFIAVWFAPGSGGSATLKARIFSAAGAPGGVLTIGTSRVPPSASASPRLAFSPDGHVMVVTSGLAGGRSSIDAWYLSAGGIRQIGPTRLVTNVKPLMVDSLIRLPNGEYFVGFTQGGAPTATRALGQRFHFLIVGAADAIGPHRLN